MNSSISKNKSWRTIGLVAFLIQGGWTLWVNLPYGLVKAAPSAVLQGLLSAASASAMTLIMEWLYGALPHSPLRPAWCIAATSLLMATILFLLHCAIGTPEVLKTLLLPMTAIVAYATAYTLRLARR